MNTRLLSLTMFLPLLSLSLLSSITHDVPACDRDQLDLQSAMPSGTSSGGGGTSDGSTGGTGSGGDGRWSLNAMGASLSSAVASATGGNIQL